MMTVERLASSIDWRRTALGSRDAWPPALAAVFSIAQHSSVPTMIFWGDELVTLYNDAIIPVLGERHPGAFAAAARDVFGPLWHRMAPAIEDARSTNRRGIVRIGDREYEYVPIFDGTDVAGVFCSTTAMGGGARIAETERALVERFADVLPQLTWISDANGRRIYQNRSWTERTGFTGLDDTALTIHPEDREATLADWKYAVSTGTPFARDYRLWDTRERRYGWVHARAQAVTEGGRIVRWVGISTDIDRRKREEFAIAFLSNASAKLNATLDPHAILQEAARLPLGEFAEFAFAYVYQSGRLHRIAAVHADSRKQALVDRMTHAAGDPQLSPQAHRLLLLGEPMIYSDIDDATLAAWAETPAQADAMIRGDLRSMIRAPIEVGGRIVGAISICRTSDSPRFDATDVRLVGELARRTSIAVANADIYQREHRIALSFQDAAMPRTLERRAGITVEGFYAPASTDARVGGDWYDATPLPDGRIVLSIGDVSGSGLDAAVVMSMVRYAIRSAAHVLADPASIVQAVDAVVRSDAQGYFVTAFVAVLDPVTMDMRSTNAGHPPPLLIADGAVRELEGPSGMPLGIVAAAARQAQHVRLAAGAQVLFYTDGLIESDGSFLPGLDALVTLLASGDVAFEPHAIYQRLLPQGSRDDTALLAVTVDPAQLRDGMYEIVARVDGVQAASRLRERANELLARVGLDGDRGYDARLAIGEIVANIARHAPGDARVIVDTTMEHIVVHVIDSGEGFVYQPHPPTTAFAESGRGMFIAHALADRFSVSPTPEGGSHVRMVFPR